MLVLSKRRVSDASFASVVVRDVEESRSGGQGARGRADHPDKAGRQGGIDKRVSYLRRLDVSIKGSSLVRLTILHPTATLGLIANRTARNGPYRARLNAALLECARWDSCIVACRFVAITAADPRIDQQDHVHRDSGCSMPDAIRKRVKTPSTAHCGWSRSVRNAKSAQEVLTKEQGRTIYKAKRSR